MTEKMKFISGKVYTHKNLLDTNIFVGKAEQYDKCWVLNVVWLTKSGNALASDNITIREEAYPEWYEA